MLGIKTTILKESKYIGDCPHCKNGDTVTLYVSQDSTHFLGFSYWPLKKIVYSNCRHCKQILLENEMPSMMRLQAIPLLKSSKTPIKMYGGLWFIVVMFGYGLYSSYSADLRADTLVNNPKVNDLYYTQFIYEEFGAMKVVRVTKDSVFFNPTRYTSDKEEGIARILKKENPFNAEEIGFSKKELQEFSKTQKIIDIKR